MVGPSYKENFQGKREREEKNKKKKQKESLQEQSADLRVTQAKALPVGQSVMDE